MRTTWAIGSSVAETLRRRRVVGRPQGSSTGGFTLIELSIVVFIIALLGGVTAPYFVRSYNNAVLSETVRRFITACEYARFQAVLRQRPSKLHVDMAQQRYWVSQPIKTEGSSQEQTLKVFEISRRVRLVAGQVGEEMAETRGQVIAQFYPNGTADALQVLWQGQERGQSLLVVLDPVTARAKPQPMRP